MNDGLAKKFCRNSKQFFRNCCCCCFCCFVSMWMNERMNVSMCWTNMRIISLLHRMCIGSMANRRKVPMWRSSAHSCESTDRNSWHYIRVNSLGNFIFANWKSERMWHLCSVNGVSCECNQGPFLSTTIEEDGIHWFSDNDLYVPHKLLHARGSQRANIAGVVNVQH